MILVLLLLLLLLLLQFVAGIQVVFLGIQVFGGPAQGFLEHIHGRLPVFLGDGHVSAVEIVIGGKRFLGGRELDGVQLFGGFVKVLLPVQVVGQVVVGGHGRGVLHQRLAVADIGLGIFLFLELPVAAPEVRLLSEGA